MGDSVVGWFCASFRCFDLSLVKTITDADAVPILGKPVDGTDYEVNPRFDAEGRWRRREEWPENLR